MPRRNNDLADITMILAFLLIGGVIYGLWKRRETIMHYIVVFITILFMVVAVGLVITIIVWIIKKLSNKKIKEQSVSEPIRFQRKESPPEPTRDKWPYKKKDYLFLVSELKFYRILKQVVHDKLVIFPKVRLGDIVRIPRAHAYNKSLWYRIQAKHIDFLLCRPENASPVMAIELDGPSHDWEKAKGNDNFKNEVFEDVGLPLLRVDKSYYNPEKLKQAINDALEQN